MLPRLQQQRARTPIIVERLACMEQQQQTLTHALHCILFFVVQTSAAWMGKRERARARKHKANAQADRLKRTTTSSSSNSSSRAVAKPKPKPKPQSTPRDAVRYAASQRILVVGDGDMSFSWGLVQHVGGSGSSIIASTLDSRAGMEHKYPDKAARNRARLLAAGCSVLHGVDATKLQLRKEFEAVRFDRIVFNFPHSGQQRVHVNRAMLSGFFHSAARCVEQQGGQVHVTIKMAPPYSLWGIEGLAASAKLRHAATLPFDQALFPGYRHQTTRADAKALDVAQGAQSRLCKTLVFVLDQRAV